MSLHLIQLSQTPKQDGSTGCDATGFESRSANQARSLSVHDHLCSSPTQVLSVIIACLLIWVTVFILVECQLKAWNDMTGACALMLGRHSHDMVWVRQLQPL